MATLLARYHPMQFFCWWFVKDTNAKNHPATLWLDNAHSADHYSASGMSLITVWMHVVWPREHTLEIYVSHITTWTVVATDGVCWFHIRWDITFLSTLKPHHSSMKNLNISCFLSNTIETLLNLINYDDCLLYQLAIS